MYYFSKLQHIAHYKAKKQNSWMNGLKKLRMLSDLYSGLSSEKLMWERMIATISEGTKGTFLKNAHTHRKCIIGKYYKECVLWGEPVLQEGQTEWGGSSMTVYLLMN